MRGSVINTQGRSVMRLNHKIRLLVMVLAIVFCLNATAHSQALLILLFGDKLSTENFQMGINFSIALPNINGIDGTSINTGWAFGMFGEIKINETWSLQPELTLKTPGGAKDLPYIGTGDPAVDSIITDAE